MIVDSIGKKIMRARMWLTLKPLLKKDSQILVLTGPTAGDISCALAVGVAPRNILAIDKDPKLVVSARLHYPQAKHKNISLEELASAGARFDAVILDLCTPLTANSLATLNVGRKLLKPRGILTYTFLCGRENPSTEVYKEINSRKKKYKENSAQLSRLSYLRDWLESAQDQTPPSLHQLISNAWLYDSRNPDEKGCLPMGVVLIRTAPQIPLELLLGIRRDKFIATQWLRKPTKKDLVEEADKFKQMNLPEAQLLNIPRATLVAVRAHATRGTYL